MIDERSLLPLQIRGPEAATTRRDLYALAAGRRGVDFGDLTVDQQDKVRRWAGRMGEGRTIEIRTAQDGTITLWDLSEPVYERVSGVAAVLPAEAGQHDDRDDG